jgi:hypothetical protein
MTVVSPPSIEERLPGMAAVIHQAIPGSEVLNALWDQLAQADVSLDLLLYSQSECDERRHWRSHVIGHAYREGRLIDELG